MRIKVNKEKCSGCHLCETMCSLFHLGVVNAEKSAVRIEKDDLDTSLNSPVVCRQCKKMKCLEGEEVSPEVEKERSSSGREREIEEMPVPCPDCFWGQFLSL